MLSFRQFLILAEALKGSESADDRGKLEEILTGFHLNGGKHVKHFREESTGKTPKQVHDKIVEKHFSEPDSQGKTGTEHEDYKETLERTQMLAKKIKEHLENEHGASFDESKGHIPHVYWTSNPNDPEKVTGIRSATRGDLMLVHHHKDDEKNVSMDEILKKLPKDNRGKPIMDLNRVKAISLKVGSKAPMLENPGNESISRYLRHPDDPTPTAKKRGKLFDTLEAQNEERKKVAAEFGYVNDREKNKLQHRADLTGVNGKKRKTQAETLIAKSLEQRQNSANTIAAALQRLHDTHPKHITNLITKLLTKDAPYKTIYAKSSVDKNGKSIIDETGKPKTIIRDENDNIKIKQHHGKSYIIKQNGIDVNIHKVNDDGSSSPILMIQAKGSPFSSTTYPVKSLIND